MLYPRKYGRADDCLIVGDGKKKIQIDDLQKILQDNNLKIGPNTRIDIHAHGRRAQDGRHAINLFNNMFYTNEIFNNMKNMIGYKAEVPLYVHLWSCYGGSTNKAANKLDVGSVLVTHVEAKESSSESFGKHARNASLKRYLDPKNNLTPHQQFVLDIQENYEAATFNHITKEGKHQKFKFTRIPKEASKQESRQEIFMADILEQIDSHDTIHNFVKDFFAKEGERFKKTFPTVNVEYAIRNVSNINEEIAKKFAQGVLIHAFHVQNQSTITSAKNLLDKLQSKGIDINGSPDNNMNALHWAAKKGHADKVKLLLGHGADVTIHDKEGKTPLHLAAESGNLTVVEALVDQNLDTMILLDNNQQTPLHLAAAFGHVTVVKALIEKNLDMMTILDQQNLTPLHYAAAKGYTEVVKALIEKNLDTITVPGQYNFIPLHLAAISGSTEIVEALIEKNSESICLVRHLYITHLPMVIQR